MSKCCSTVVGMLATFSTTYMLGYGYGGYEKKSEKEIEKPQIFTEKPKVEVPIGEPISPPEVGQPPLGEVPEIPPPATSPLNYLSYATANVVGLAGVYYAIRNGMITMNRPGWDITRFLYRSINRMRRYNPFRFMDDINRGINEIREFQNISHFGNNQNFLNIINQLKLLFDGVHHNSMNLKEVLGGMEKISQLSQKTGLNLGGAIEKLQQSLFENAQETSKQGNLLEDIINTQKSISENINQRISEVNERYKLNIEGPQQQILNDLNRIKEELLSRTEYGKLHEELQSAINTQIREGEISKEDLKKALELLDEIKQKDIQQLKDQLDQYNKLLGNFQVDVEEPYKPSPFFVEGSGGGRVFVPHRSGGREGGTVITLTEMEGKEEKDEPSPQIEERTINMINEITNQEGRVIESNILDAQFIKDTLEFSENTIEEEKLKKMREQRRQFQEQLDISTKKRENVLKYLRFLQDGIKKVLKLRPEAIFNNNWQNIIGDTIFDENTDTVKLRTAIRFIINILLDFLSKKISVDTVIYPTLKTSGRSVKQGEQGEIGWTGIFYNLYNRYLTEVQSVRNLDNLINLIEQAHRTLESYGETNLPSITAIPVRRGYVAVEEFFFDLLRRIIARTSLITDYINSDPIGKAKLASSITKLRQMLILIGKEIPEYDLNNLTEIELKKIFRALHFQVIS